MEAVTVPSSPFSLKANGQEDQTLVQYETALREGSSLDVDWSRSCHVTYSLQMVIMTLLL